MVFGVCRGIFHRLENNVLVTIRSQNHPLGDRLFGAMDIASNHPWFCHPNAWAKPCDGRVHCYQRFPLLFASRGPFLSQWLSLWPCSSWVSMIYKLVSTWELCPCLLVPLWTYQWVFKFMRDLFHFLNSHLYLNSSTLNYGESIQHVDHIVRYTAKGNHSFNHRHHPSPLFDGPVHQFR